MQVINVRFESGVFVPLEEINIGKIREAVVVVSEWNNEKSEESVISYQEKAKEYFKANFPDLEVSENILS